MFAYGDELFMKIMEVTELSKEHHHHASVEEHEVEHGDKEHSQDCEDECHFCVFTGISTNILPSSFQIEFVNYITNNNKIKESYTSLYTNNYLATLLQPPQV